MTIVEEEFFAGIARLRKAIGRVDLRTVEVLACHVALEKELDLTLRALLVRGDRMRGLNFVHKVTVLQAAIDNDVIDDFAPAYLAFNDLRNCAAHGDKRQIDGAYRKLCKSYPTGVVDLAKEGATIVGLATVLIRSFTLLVHDEGGEMTE